MPRRTRIDAREVTLRTRALLEARGPLGGVDLCELLSISPSTLSRCLADGPANTGIVGYGSRKMRRYASVRPCLHSAQPWPLFEIGEQGDFTVLGQLLAAGANGYLFEPAEGGELAHHFFEAAPHFLVELVPSGYLARGLPTAYPHLGLPADPRMWSYDVGLRYVVNHGSDLPGNLILGAGAFENWQRERHGSRTHVPRHERKTQYPSLAETSLTSRGGSSAGGDQPKFLAQVENEDGQLESVIVKFSPPKSETAGRRVADLLVCEHLALELLREKGFEAAKSELLEANNRVFFQASRFDRFAHGPGRRGIVSLQALAGHHTGAVENWSSATEALASLRLVSRACLAEVKARELFGHLIANTDMHAGNLAFSSKRLAQVEGLAPVYDMLPMLYTLRGGEPTQPRFEPVIPARLATEAPRMLPIAREFWCRAAADARISAAFQAIAHANRLVVEQLGAS